MKKKHQGGTRRPVAARLYGLAPARITAGLSRMQLADIIGVTEPCIRNWEIGRVVPRYESDEMRLANVLGVRVDDLYQIPRF